MKLFSASPLIPVVLFAVFFSNVGANPPSESSGGVQNIFGFHNPAQETSVETHFLAIPDPKLAKEHLRILTRAPHIAGSPEDKATADYVAGKFREAGLETEIDEYRVWMNYPSEISVDITAPPGVH